MQILSAIQNVVTSTVLNELVGRVFRVEQIRRSALRPALQVAIRLDPTLEHRVCDFLLGIFHQVGVLLVVLGIRLVVVCLAWVDVLLGGVVTHEWHRRLHICVIIERRVGLLRLLKCRICLKSDNIEILLGASRLVGSGSLGLLLQGHIREVLMAATMV